MPSPRSRHELLQYVGSQVHQFTYIPRSYSIRGTLADDGWFQMHSSFKLQHFLSTLTSQVEQTRKMKIMKCHYKLLRRGEKLRYFILAVPISSLSANLLVWVGIRPSRTLPLSCRSQADFQFRPLCCWKHFPLCVAFCRQIHCSAS